MSGSVSNRVGALCGVAFAVLLFLGVASLNVPAEVSDQELIDWWSESGNRASALASMGFITGAGIALLVFLSLLRDRLNGAGSREGNAMFAVGMSGAILFLVTAGLRGAIANAVQNDEPLPGVDMLRYVPEIWYTIIEVALMSLGATIILASVAIKRTAAFPAWLAWVGFVTGVLTIVGDVFVGPFVIPIVLIWALAASFAFWRAGSGAAEATAVVRSSLPA